MKSKWLNIALILTSLIGYLEWGQTNRTFLFQAEMELLLKFMDDPKSIIHPFVLLPFIGQLLLFFSLFQQEPAKRLTFFGIGGIGLLLLLMFVIGVISANIKIWLSTIPFIITAIFTIHHHRKKNL